MADKAFKVKNAIVIKGVEVDPSSATTGHVLTYNGSKFVAGAVPSGPTGPAGPAGPNPLQVSSSAPSSPSSGDLWFNSNNTKLYIYYDSYWVEISGNVGPTGPAQFANVGSSAPAGPQTGQLWYDTANSVLKVYDGSVWNTI